MSPEEKARIEIDKKLSAAGYILQDMAEFNPSGALGVAVREYPTNSGEVDYLIFIDGKPVGVIEAKKSASGVNLTAVAEQSKRYAESGLKYFKEQPVIRFAYEATDILTHFCDYQDISYRSREIFSFHQPEQLAEWLKESDTLRNRLKQFPVFDDTGFRKSQTQAVTKLENSFSENRSRALIQMATGAGKTFTAITSVYRLLKHAKAKRILFLVDTKNLGEQAEGEFLKYKPNDDARLFPELYNVARLQSSYIPASAHVCISTIQRMYSILRGEELPEDAENVSLNESHLPEKVREVTYNAKYPCEFFDFIIIDECHRSIYNIWQQVLDYFDAFLIGLTATPDKRTFGFFHENIVSEYSHEEAVIDDVNVSGEEYIIETDITQKGGVILKQNIEKRDRLSRRKRWEQMDEDVTYNQKQLDRDVVNPSQIRIVIKEFRHAMETKIFPNRINPETQKFEMPKTLVFAKTDSHADDIIKIIREEFGEGNEFCKKITYQSEEDPKSTLKSFRQEYYPRIAVTVDMIATGTDVKPLECLLFMRDVRSRNYFEQMKGRGTRTLGYEDLHNVTPSANERKTGYVLVDAVGVTKSLKTDSRPLERKPTVALKDLMMSVVTGDHSDDTLTTLAGRLLKLDKVLSPKEKEAVGELTNGVPLNQIASDLLKAFDPDVISEKAARDGISEDAAEKKLADAAAKPIYSPKLREYLLKVKQTHDQIIDSVNLDHVTASGWSADHSVNAEKTIETFHKFIEENKDEIEALRIIYSQSYKSRPLTLQMIKELYAKLTSAPYVLTHEKLWQAYALKQPEKFNGKNVVSQLADVVSMIRFELGQTAELTPFAVAVKARFMQWTMAKNAGNIHFTEEQMEWLRMIRDQICISVNLLPEDLELTPFAGRGGLGKFYQLFGQNYEALLAEINLALVA